MGSVADQVLLFAHRNIDDPEYQRNMLIFVGVAVLLMFASYVFTVYLPNLKEREK